MRKLNLAAALSIASLAISASLVPHQRHYRYRGSASIANKPDANGRSVVRRQGQVARNITHRCLRALEAGLATEDPLSGRGLPC